MRFPFKITRNPKVPKLKRTLPLTHVWTFDDGTEIFTYRDEDLAEISNRYVKQLKQNLAFVEKFGITQEVFKKWQKAESDILNQAIEHQMPLGKAVHQLKSLFDERDRMFEFNHSLAEDQWRSLFCMFFVLDTEDETNFSPTENKRKLELLDNSSEELQAFFLQLLQKRLAFSQIISKSDLQSFIIETKRELLKLESFSKLTTANVTRSKRVDSLEKHIQHGLMRRVWMRITKLFHRMLITLKIRKKLKKASKK